MLGRRLCQRRVWWRWFSSASSPPQQFSSQRNNAHAPMWKFFSGSSSSTSANDDRHLDFYIPHVKRYCFSTQSVIELPLGELVDVPLAQTGEGIAECELLKWFVQEGDQVEEFQPLCEVQSDKATIEITSRYKGKVAQIQYFPGEIVKVGETLLKILVNESSYPRATSVDSENAEADGSGYEKDKRGRVLSTPAVRTLAKQHGININDVCGTGKDGYYLLGDFEEQWSNSMSIAAKVPHFHYVDEIYCDRLAELKTSFQNNNPYPDVKHTFLPLLIKSLSMALIKYPLVNSCFNEESLEVVLKGSHNIGIAMATSYGLVVPNIKNVQSLYILETTKELSRLHQLASDNKLNPEDICGGTITLSNIGAIGGKFGSPLLNLPEVAIIAIGRIQKVPQFADDGNVYPASLMTVNIGADHRVLDGATVARFCNEGKKLIKDPELLMLHLR
ncbi:hypothetical protein L6164_025429 [Bauhinia variegata]|uniref:Uncharacterized protein n=1 Tax=Bauhinia variegata TaxID=167791 RepID=A0ACB9M359_BAUVA|nr:hypothetical protein L6164_025429 [Bauhinia variegata]